MSNDKLRSFFRKPPPTQAEIDLFVDAARKGDNAGIMAFLNRHPAHADQKDSNGYIALGQAADKGHKVAVALLLSHGAQVEARDRFDWPPLHHAASSGHTDVVNMLLNKGAQLEGKTKDGFTPLMWAVRFGHAETARFLLEKGARYDVVGTHGQTLQMLAGGQKEVAELVEQWPEMIRRREEEARLAKEREAAAAKEKKVKEAEARRQEKLKGHRPPKPPFKGRKPGP